VKINIIAPTLLIKGVSQCSTLIPSQCPTPTHVITPNYVISSKFYWCQRVGASYKETCLTPA